MQNSIRPDLNGPCRSLIPRDASDLRWFFDAKLDEALLRPGLNGLSRELPDRMQALVDNERDRINK